MSNRGASVKIGWSAAVRLLLCRVENEIAIRTATVKCRSAVSTMSRLKQVRLFFFGIDFEVG
jgi:hypothetical protein